MVLKRTESCVLLVDLVFKVVTALQAALSLPVADPQSLVWGSGHSSVCLNWLQILQTTFVFIPYCTVSLPYNVPDLERLLTEQQRLKCHSTQLLPFGICVSSLDDPLPPMLYKMSSCPLLAISLQQSLVM